MNDDIDRLARVLTRHDWWSGQEYRRCTCGMRFDTFVDWRRHRAQAVWDSDPVQRLRVEAASAWAEVQRERERGEV